MKFPLRTTALSILLLQTVRELPVVSLILVNNNALRSYIPTHSNLQADVVSLSLHLFNIYSPSSRLSLKILMILFLNYLLPTYCWGSKDINDKGRILETFINNHGLCLYNNISSPLCSASYWLIYFYRHLYMLSHSSFRL